MALWSLAGTIGDLMAHGDANINVTIFNTSMLLAGVCHLAGAVLSLRPGSALRLRRVWLGVGCAAALAALGLITRVTLEGGFPVFFIPGQGGTAVRYCVLVAATAMFVLAAVVLLAGWREQRPPFAYWYSLALLLLAVGLFGVTIQLSLWSAVNWLARTAQWLGGVYLLVAAVGSVRESGLPLFAPQERTGSGRYRYGVAVAVALGAAALRLAFLPALGMRAPFLMFYPAVMLVALYGGLRAGLLATALSGALANYFWMEPRWQFSIRDPGDWLSLVIFLLSGWMISWVSEVMQGARARALAAETLRESERQQRVLAQLGDLAARGLASGPLVEAIGEYVARELGVSRCGFSRVDVTAGQVRVVADYHSYLPSLSGVYPLAGYADYYLQDGLAGRPAQFEDLATDPRTASAYAANYAPIQVRAHLTVPLLRAGQWVANFWVSHHEPRHWPAAEIAVMQAVGDRVWAVVERQRAEEAVRRAADFDEAALKSLGEGLYTIDTQGLVTSMNPAAEQLFGWTFAELRGKKMHDMTHHHYRDGRPFPACECAGFPVLTHGAPLKDYEDVFIRKDGSFFDVSYSIAPMRDAAGGITGLVGGVQ